jgi:histidine triad (HIT) family protein
MVKRSKNCIFCRIVSGEVKEEFIYEDEHFIVHKDIHPRTSTHLLITTKKHLDDYSEMMEKEPDLLKLIGLVVEKVVVKLGLEKKPYTWGFHSGVKSSVKHLHAQLLAGMGEEELIL